MRLKTIEIKGFKSFANQTVIHFNEDVIGIVGPNGSGKSNIVDAIRWVLGEQKSRELRLDQMSSVIFNGTKKRKPSGVASVSLTFDNTKNLLPTEYHTVTITRMLYRSGESEYRLNDVPCRLKDIKSLLLDTGMGSNSYAIIALGMVDDILTDKENSRRKMFEQAAGISKYKVRKRETVNKLKSTSADLERVEDLLHEIDANLKSLEKQARRTKRYYELKASYKELAVGLAQVQMQVYKTQHQEISQKIEQEQDAYRGHTARTKALESALEKERKLHVDKEKALSQRQRDLNALVGKIRGMENDRRMLEQKKEFVDQNQQKLNAEINLANTRIADLETEIEGYREDLNIEKHIEARLEMELEQAEDSLEKIRTSHGTLKADLDQIVQEQQRIERSVFDLEKRRAVNTNQIESNRQELERNQLEITQRASEIQSLTEQVNVLNIEEQGFQKTLESLQNEEGQRIKQLEQTEQDLEQINRKMAQVRRELDAKQNEFKLTKSMVENLEGFPESIKFLSNHKDWQEQAPLLSDLMYVKEEYRVGIEHYLEPYLNYYVVETLEQAARAVQLLGRSQKGKANFFVLEAFANYTAPMTLIPETRSAIDLIQVEPKFYNLCSYLLANVLVTDQEDLSKSLPDAEVVLLSKSGRLIKRQYSISGGSIGLFEGKKIGRKKNLEHLEETIRQAESKENKLSTQFYTAQERIQKLKRKQLGDQITQQKNSLNNLRQQKVSLTTRLENFESFIQEINRKQDQTNQRIQGLEQSNLTIDEDLSQQQSVLAEAKEKITNTDGSYRKVAEQLSEASASFNEKNIAFIRQQNKVNALQRELTFREKQLGETRHSLEANQSTITRNSSESQGIAHQVIDLQNQLKELYIDRKDRESLLTDAEQTYFDARGQITGIEDELRKVSRSQQEVQVLINRLKETFSDVKYEITTIAQRLRIEFDVDINDVINRELEIEEMPEGALLEKVEKLKKRLDNYGEINPMAVEAFDEMKERFDSITKQRDDILEAKSSLEETIKEIEETATVQFLDAFEKARLYFIDVFRSLFTEDDTCDLLLLDPENPLESNIEIVAKPKGKRPQTINQLSGGEKTLTATALLFALYLLKPAPFCIFDEVDAPLDDANVFKFNKIIKKFSADSQFIIVTHNKLTMAAVDTIYGVYMGEQGVSGVTAVDFRDFENTVSFEAANEN
ncbi:MAG: chromosome segregation protein SMC [Saprospiraceae bacterium]|nr:chromosome segregation protein SMC [Saprospiraceae bacterium]